MQFSPRRSSNPHFRKRKRTGTSGPTKRPSSSSSYSTRSMSRTKVRSRDSVVSFIISPCPVERNESHVSAKTRRSKNRRRKQPAARKSITSPVCFINDCKTRHRHLCRKKTEPLFIDSHSVTARTYMYMCLGFFVTNPDSSRDLSTRYNFESCDRKNITLT